MQVLGTQNYFLSPRTKLRLNSTPLPTLPLQLSALKEDNFKISKKNTFNRISKRNMRYDQLVEDFKQNNTKQKLSQQLYQLDPLNSNMQHLTTPFSSVANRRSNTNKLHSIKSQPKTHDSETKQTQKIYPSRIQEKKDLKKAIGKVIENRLNQIAEKKRKSVSYRIHIAPKQPNFNQQSKRNIHPLPSEIQRKLLALGKQPDQHQRALHISRQKSSQSFIIRKKVNSHVMENQRPEKGNSQVAYCGQNYSKEGIAKEGKFESLGSALIRHQTESYQKITGYRFQDILLRGQTQELRSSGNKYLLIKNHQTKAVKGLNARVNKLIKPQQQIFFQDSEIQSKHYHQVMEKQKIKQKSVNLSRLSQREQKNNETETQKQISKESYQGASENQVQQNQIIQGLEEEKSVIQNSIELQKDSDGISIPKLYFKTSESEENKNENQSSLKKTNEKQNVSGLKNRKTRISSIRAIKNYYKKLDTEEKSSVINEDKDSKEVAQAKKKQREQPCLTHKIKWGNFSKKKLNTDRGIDIMLKPIQNQCSVQGNIKKNKFDVEQAKRIIQQNQRKTTIQIQLQGDKARKKGFRKVEFLQDNYQKYGMDFQSDEREKDSKVQGRNIKKCFPKTIDSKQHMSNYNTSEYPGSKSLILFEDPGLSVIFNKNNSIHIAQTPHTLHIFEGHSLTGIQTIQNNFISPIPAIKKPVFSNQQKSIEEDMPLQSLQQLYYELKSHKTIPFKQNIQSKADSLQQICEK